MRGALRTYIKLQHEWFGDEVDELLIAWLQFGQGLNDLLKLVFTVVNRLVSVNETTADGRSMINPWRNPGSKFGLPFGHGFQKHLFLLHWQLERLFDNSIGSRWDVEERLNVTKHPF
jgi:hypothetical protein